LAEDLEKELVDIVVNATRRAMLDAGQGLGSGPQQRAATVVQVHFGCQLLGSFRRRSCRYLYFRFM